MTHNMHLSGYLTCSPWYAHYTSSWPLVEDHSHEARLCPAEPVALEHQTSGLECLINQGSEVRDGMGLLYSSMFGEAMGGKGFPIWGMQGCAALRGLGGEEI
jgi:hypothetical protein